MHLLGAVNVAIINMPSVCMDTMIANWPYSEQCSGESEMKWGGEGRVLPPAKVKNVAYNFVDPDIRIIVG